MIWEIMHIYRPDCHTANNPKRDSGVPDNIALFEAIVKNSSDTTEKGSCEMQIGVCHFFLGGYEKALEDYIKYSS
jgi:hypothetical protein